MPTKDFNNQQYSKNYQKYLDNNPEGAIGGGTPQTRAGLLEKYLPIGRMVFEIGAGEGLDSLQLQKAGYKVTVSDYVDRFIQILNEKGLDSALFDAKNDELPISPDCIYANAVFVHFSPEELMDFLKRAKEKLTNERIVFLSVIKGEGYERSARSVGFERDFYYYSTDSLKELIRNGGYKILYLNDEDPKWIQAVIASG